MRRDKKLDQTLSALVLGAYAVIWLIQFIMSMTSTNEGLLRGIDIARIVMQILTFIVLFYNAWGWSGNLIYRIIIIAVTAWLIFCTIAPFIPGLEAIKQYMYK